ncbi:MAG: HAD family phosphatase [bacterium]|nr:HAD family phosphatase [bacterium]
MIEAIFFDLGRVIIDFDHLRIARSLMDKAVGKAGCPPEEFFNWLFDRAHGACTLFDRGQISEEDFYLQICKTYDLELSFIEFSTIWNETFKEITEVSQLISQLSTRYPLYLISNTNSLHFGYIVEQFPILKHFQSYILSYREGLCKPDPKIYRRALARAGTPADRSLYIDDIAPFVHAARELGFYGIHFTSADHLKTRLSTLLPFNFAP